MLTGEGEIYGANYQNLKSFLQIRAYLSVARCKLGGTAGRALGGIWIERQWKNNAAICFKNYSLPNLLCFQIDRYCKAILRQQTNVFVSPGHNFTYLGNIHASCFFIGIQSRIMIKLKIIHKINCTLIYLRLCAKLYTLDCGQELFIKLLAWQ